MTKTSISAKISGASSEIVTTAAIMLGQFIPIVPTASTYYGLCGELFVNPIEFSRRMLNYKPIDPESHVSIASKRLAWGLSYPSYALSYGIGRGIREGYRFLRRI